MLNQDEIIQLKSLFPKFIRTVEFSFHKTQENKFGRTLENLVSWVCDMSDGKCITVPVTSDRTPVAAPCFTVGAGGHANIVYAALPTGHQFAPFRKILERIGCGEYKVPDEKVEDPAELTVLISDSCPRCPLVVEAAGLAACGEPGITASFVDVMQFQKFVTEYKVLSVPATILDRQVVSIGTLSKDRILELVRSRGTDEIEKEAIQSLIESKQIPEAAGRLGSEAGRAVIMELLQHEEFSKRLNGLVVMERAVEDNPDATRAMVPLLLPLLSHKDSRIRGDVADLLGKIGDPRAISQLEALASDPDPDVVEAAADALDELKKNS